MNRYFLLLLLFSFSKSLNAQQWISSNPAGPDYCVMQSVTYTYSPVNPNNTFNWYVDDYGPFSIWGTPATMFAGNGTVLTIPPFQYSPGTRVRMQETDLFGSIVGETYVFSVFQDPTSIPTYFHSQNCGMLEVAAPYDGNLSPLRWSMWYRDGIATGLSQGTIYGPLLGGMYQYKVILSCSTDTLFSDLIYISGIPEPQVTPSGSTTFCDGDSVVLTLQPGFSISNWRKNNVAIPGTGGMTSLTVTTSGNYTVQVYTGAGSGSSCYQVSTPIAVTVNPAAIITAPTVACSGDSITLTCTPATTYQWKRYGTNIPGATSQTLKVIQSGNYEVITTGLTCNISDVHNLQYYAKPSGIAMSQSGPVQLCKNEALSLTVSGNNISSWNWLKNGISMAGSNTPTITVTKPGNYKCVVSNAIGCSKTSQVANVTTPVATELPSKSVTIKPGVSGTDSYTTCAFGNFGTNFGNATTLEVSAWYKHFRTAERGYLKFDLASIPEQSPILSATLKLYADTAVVYQSGLQTLFVKRVIENWLENTISWYIAPDSSVFQTSSIPVNAAQSNTTVSVSVTDIVRHWTFNPSENHGFLLHMEENISGAVKVGWMSFYSGDNSNASSRPKLTIKYAFADITENGPLSFCAGGSVQFSTNPGYNYQWYRNNNAIAGANAANYTANTAGDYYVILSNAVGCTVKSATKTVTIPCRAVEYNSEEIQIIHQQGSDEITAVLPFNEGIINIFNITGQLISTYNCHERDCVLASNHLSPGIYIVRVISGNMVKSKKLVIE